MKKSSVDCLNILINYIFLKLKIEFSLLCDFWTTEKTGMDIPPPPPPADWINYILLLIVGY